MRRLEDFGKIKVFADLTYKNLLDFDEYLRQFIKSAPTLYKRHSLLRDILMRRLKGDFVNLIPKIYLKFQKVSLRSLYF